MVAPDVMQPRTVESPCKCRAHLFRKGIRKMMISANVARNENALAKAKVDGENRKLAEAYKMIAEVSIMRNAAMGRSHCFVFMPQYIAKIVGSDIEECGFGFSPAASRSWYCISWQNNESV